MAADLSMELKSKMKGCVSENEMFLHWGELRKGSVGTEQKFGIQMFPVF